MKLAQRSSTQEMDVLCERQDDGASAQTAHRRTKKLMDFRSVYRSKWLYLTRLVVVLLLLYFPLLPHEQVTKVTVLVLTFVAAGLWAKNEKNISFYSDAREIRPFCTTVVMMAYRYVEMLPAPWDVIMGGMKLFAIDVGVASPPPSSLNSQGRHCVLWRLLWDGGTILLWVVILPIIAWRIGEMK